MNVSSSPELVTIIVAAIAAVGAYVAAARRLSGKIATSEASSLWEESASIRSDYRDRLAKSEERQALLEARVAKAEDSANNLARANLELTRKTVGYETTIEELREQVEECRTENASLRATIRKVGGFGD